MLSVQTFEVMKAILGEKGFGASGWKKLVSSGKIQKVYKESDGSIHWVAGVHATSLGENGYRIDQRLGGGQVALSQILT